jgi:hypothetical protein
MSTLLKRGTHTYTRRGAYMQVPPACARQSDGLWAKREAQRAFCSLVRRELRSSELQRMHALPTRCGGPPTLCNAFVSQQRPRCTRRGAASELQHKMRGARETPLAEQDGLWQALQLQECGRAACLQAAAAKGLAGVEEGWVRHAAEATPFAAAPFEGSFEDNITCA